MGDARPGEVDPAGVERRGRRRSTTQVAQRRGALPRARTGSSRDVARPRSRSASRRPPTIKRALGVGRARCRTSSSRCRRTGARRSRARVDRTPTASRRVDVHADERRRRRRSRRRPSRSPRRCRASTRRRRSRGRAERAAARRRRARRSSTGSSQTAAFKAQVARRRRSPTPSTLTLGETSRDRVTISGRRRRLPGRRSTARLFGPFRSTGAIRCDGDAGVGGHVHGERPGRRTRRRAVKPPSAGLVRLPAGRPGNAGHVGTDDELHRPARARARSIAQPTVAHAGQHAAGRRRAPRSPTRSTVDGLGGETGDRAGRALRAVPEPRRDQLRRHAGLDGHGRGDRRRRVPHRAVQADDARLLHLPREHRRERVRARDRDAVPRRRPRRRSCRRRRRSTRR